MLYELFTNKYLINRRYTIAHRNKMRRILQNEQTIRQQIEKNVKNEELIVIITKCCLYNREQRIPISTLHELIKNLNFDFFSDQEVNTYDDSDNSQHESDYQLISSEDE